MFIGKYDFTDLVGVHKQFHEEFGEIAKFSGIKPRNDIVFAFQVDDIETVHRNEGIWPVRPPLLSLQYYRKKIRKDFFEGLAGVLVE